MKTIGLLLIVSILVNICHPAYSQKERNIWCFGNFAKVDFSTDTPVYPGPCEINTIEGCASISDYTSGQLLFYTDGIKVFDHTNQVMPSDTVGLGGNPSTTQSAFILPLPGSDHEYYLFGTDAQVGYMEAPGPDQDSGTEYSIIEMNLNGGLGDVAQQPRHLLAPATEKVAATFNADSTGYWLVLHLWNSDAFYAYPITVDGIGDPVISHSGVQANADGTPDNSSAIGYMRISPDGSKIAVAWHDSINTIQIFNFDRTTGTVSAPIFAHSGFGALGPYGLCFSPNGQFLYYTLDQAPVVYQYNMQALSDTGILIRRTGSNAWGLQLGPDNKIYVALEDVGAIDQIAYPDSEGFACGYVPAAVILGGATCELGLPEFPPMGHITKVTTGITNLMKEEKLSVYPNPSTGSWQLSASDNLVGSDLDIYDNEGRLVFHSTLNSANSKLNLAVAKGIYFMRISSPSATIVRKLVRL